MTEFKLLWLARASTNRLSDSPIASLRLAVVRLQFKLLRLAQTSTNRLSDSPIASLRLAVVRLRLRVKPT